MSLSNHVRMKVERLIAKRTIEALLASGATLSVDYGDEYGLERSRDVEAILEAMFAVDEAYLVVCAPGRGWVRFIYGNDGPDVINDYTTNLEEVLKPVMALADQIEEGQFTVAA